MSAARPDVGSSDVGSSIVGSSVVGSNVVRSSVVGSNMVSSSVAGSDVVGSDLVRLNRPSPTPVPAPVLDDAQRRVVEHRSGPLLVLAGPGTGKTTTITEAVVARISSGEVRPDEVLVLTFSRRAAVQL